MNERRPLPGADPGFVVSGGGGGGVSRREVWQAGQSPGRGPGGRSPPEALAFEELQTFI